MVGVILAAGDGKRMKESSKEDYCKPLIKVNGKRLIEYALDNLVDLGIDKAYIVVGKEGNLIKKVLGEVYSQLDLFYVVQEEQKGIVDAFLQAVKVIDAKESVVLQLSDEIFIDLKIEKIRKSIESKKYDFYCGITYEDDVSKIKNNFSVDTDTEGLLIRCVEKPVEVNNNIKGTGLCVFGNKALDFLIEEYNRDTNEIKDLCDYMNLLIENEINGFAIFVADKEFNINTLQDLEEAKNEAF